MTETEASPKAPGWGGVELRDLTPQQFANGMGYLVLVGLVVRLIYFFDHGNSAYFAIPLLDQIYYDMAARILSEGGDVSQLRGFRPMLYPLFLSVFYRLGGDMGLELSLVVQHVLGIGTGVLVALIGARFFRNRACGLAGGFIYLLAGPPLYFEGELLITSSYTFLIVVTLLLHLRAVEASPRHALWLWLACGAMTALTAQARANMLIFLGIFPLYAAWRWWRTRNPREWIPMAGWVGALVMLGLWGIANVPQSGRFQLIPSAGGLNLYLGNHRSADGMIPEQEWVVSYGGDDYRDSLAVFAEQEYARAMREAGEEPSDDPMAVSHYWTSRALGEIRADPARWLGLMAKKSWMIFWNTEIPNNNAYAFIVREESLVLGWLPVRWCVLLALFPLGILAFRGRGAPEQLFVLVGYLVLYAAGIVGFFVCSRYRIPLWPAMSVVAGGGVLLLEALIRERDAKRLKLAAGIVGAALLLSLVNWVGAELPSFARDYFFRSIAHYERGEYGRALADIDESLVLTTHDATAVLHRGNVLFAMDRMEEARAAYEQVAETLPNDASVLNNLGAASEHLGDYRAAYEAYRKGLEQKPYNTRTVINLAVLRLRAGLLDDAERTLRLLEPGVFENDVLALCARADLARRRQQIQAARELSERALTIGEVVARDTLNRLASPLSPSDLGL